MPNGKRINRKLRPKVKTSWKNIIVYLFLFLFMAFLFLGFNQSSTSQSGTKTVPVSQIITDVKNKKVIELDISNTKITAKEKGNVQVQAFKEQNSDIYQLFNDAGVSLNSTKVVVQDDSAFNNWVGILSTVLPVLLMVLFFYFIFRQARGAQESIFSFGKSRAKVFSKDTPRISFSDVAGVDEAKQELTEIVDFLKNPGKYKAMGARTPKGVLMVGPSGTGKTLLARATAGEANVPFFSMAGSEFMEMLVGIGASVTGDTPVLIKQNGTTRLLPIGEFVNQFYNSNYSGIVSVDNVETLGFDSHKAEDSGFYGYKNGKMQRIVGSSFKKVSSVFRHKVNEIYEIHYIGGIVKTTADHSVFIRRHGRIMAITTKDIKKGDILVELPLNIRLPYKKGLKQRHKIISHEFPQAEDIFLDVWNDDQQIIENYKFAMEQKGIMSQYAIAEQIGVSQMTVSHWQNEIHLPQKLSKKLVKLNLPDKTAVTTALMKLFGYYTAEGRGTNNLEFTFGIHEILLHQDIIHLMRETFGVSPVLEKTADNTLRIKYYSAHLGRFFVRHCGNGSHNKHVPEFIWDMPKEHFLAYFEGYWQGDGYQTKDGKLSITSVSKQLILELSWLCSMHGIKVGIKHGYQEGGRIIKNKPLPAGEYWNIIIGKTSNPFSREQVVPSFQFKRAIVQKIVKKPYKGFVYDLCGVENEAFFGGDKPVLLHNSRVRDLFSNAKKAQPAIIFIDEIDAIGRQRGGGLMGGHDEREQTLNQILVEMDGFTPNEQLVVMAATNRPDVLDPALVRPGRFDRRVALDMPDVNGRKDILAIHARGKPFLPEVDWAKIARRTVGFSGADLENMLNEAAILAARLGKKAIDMSDLEEAATKVKLGPEKKRLQTEEDRKMTAYHEAGHALVSWFMPHMDPVNRISIVSRSMTLGHTQLEETDRVHETKTRLIEAIAVILGGRAAENLIFKEMTTGASDDIAKATELARAMVVEYGMSELGPVNFNSENFTRRNPYEQLTISPDMASKIDTQIKSLTDTGYKTAQKILLKLRKKLDKLAEELLKKETIESGEFEKLMGPRRNPALVAVKSY